jgi:hypothetical protein
MYTMVEVTFESVGTFRVLVSFLVLVLIVTANRSLNTYEDSNELISTSGHLICFFISVLLSFLKGRGDGHHEISLEFEDFITVHSHVACISFVALDRISLPVRE